MPTKNSPAPAKLDDEGATARLRLGKRGLPILNQFSEEGFVDCVFRISKLTRGRRHYRFHLGASFAGTAVGVDCRVVRGVRAGLDAEMDVDPNHVYREGVEFKRSGPESDRFLVALAKLYGFRKQTLRMVPSVAFTGIALHQGEIEMATMPIKIKLFGFDGPDEAEKYNESYFNLDLKNRLVFWNEKDPEYRAALVGALSA